MFANVNVNPLDVMSLSEKSGHDQLIAAALTSQNVALLKRVEFDQEITSVESQPDQQETVQCIKNEYLDEPEGC